MGILDLFKGDRRSKNAKAVIINLIMIVFASFYTIFYNYNAPKFDTSAFGAAGLIYATRYVPMLVLGALGGSIPGFISVFIVFLHRSIAEGAFSYMTFIYLVVVGFADMSARRKWFSSYIRTAVITVIMQFIVGVAWGIVLMLLSVDGIYTISVRQVVLLFLNALPGCVTGCYLIYFIFKKLPTKYKLMFDNGKFYVNRNDLSDDDKYEVAGKSRIGKVIMGIIVVEALILGIAAELSSNTLIPQMKNDIFNAEGTVLKEELADINSTERLESKVNEQLVNESMRVDGQYIGSLLTNTGHNYRYSVKLAMLISIIIIPLSALINKYAQYRIARPIRMLSKAVSMIYNSNDQELQESVRNVHELRIETNDEIEDMYRSIDLTLYRLVEYIELVRTRQNIEDQLNIAKSANEAKTRFLSNISHEIRTPINAVLGFDEMILRESRDENVVGYAMDIQGAGKTLLALINEILDFSKIEAGKMEIIPVEYDLASMLNDIVNMADVKAREKNLNLSVNVNEDMPHILFGDEIRIKQCILNIITNAVKYTERGTVTLDVDYEVVEFDENDISAEDAINLKVSVADTGIGIKEEDIDRLSAAFERIDAKKNRTIEGTGLGISIVVSLLELMESRLDVSSEYGKGSTFSFDLKQRVVSWEAVGDFSQKVREAQKHAGSYKESFHAKDARILVVDDTRTNLTVIEGLLKKTRIQIDTATSGMEAIERVAANRYDIIFMDHRMPEMDGIQTFHAMEEMDNNLSSGSPVVALTANAISGSREMYIREGFANYLSKPVDSDKLEEMILMYLPKEIVSRPGDPDFEDVSADSTDDENQVFQELLKIGGIDVNSAIERCGSALTARDVMKDFWLSIDERAGLIEKYLQGRNIKDFTIYVHGLKSSAKAIGALDLSEKAEYLEECGNGGDIDEIEMLTPELLELYRSYINKLDPLFKEDESDKPEIGAEELENAFASIKEFVSASYYDSADDIMTMLNGYSIPQQYKDKFHEVKRLLAAVDRDGLLNIL